MKVKSLNLRLHLIIPIHLEKKSETVYFFLFLRKMSHCLFFVHRFNKKEEKEPRMYE
jgi:phage-related protein